MVSGDTCAVIPLSGLGKGDTRHKPRSPVQESVGTLIEMTSDSVNGLSHQAEEWEEIEFLVDSGASVTVVGDETVKAVQAVSPSSEKQYKLADGSTRQSSDGEPGGR